MATNTVINWFGNIVSHPAVIVDANSVDDIVAVMKDPLKYPSRFERLDRTTRRRLAELPMGAP